MSETLGELQAQYNELQHDYFKAQLHLLEVRLSRHLMLQAEGELINEYLGPNVSHQTANARWNWLISILETMIVDVNEKIRTYKPPRQPRYVSPRRLLK